MKKLLFLMVLSGLANATSLDESFGGLARPALQDTLGGLSVWDPFNADANPAWAPHDSGMAVASGLLASSLGTRAQEQSTAIMLMLDGQKAWDKHWIVGLLGAVPMGPGSLLDTGDASFQIPFWTNRARGLTMNPYFEGVLDSLGLSFGVSLPVVFNIDTYVQLTKPDGTNYSLRTQAGIRPSLSYVLGLNYTAIPGWNFGVAYHEKQTVRTYGDVRGSFSVVTLNGSFDDEGDSPYSFVPRRILFQASHELTRDFTLGLMFRYSMWSEMPSPFFHLTYSDPQLLNIPSAPFPTRSIWEEGLGASYKFNEYFSVYGSYRYQPTPLLSTAGFYDANQQIVGLGAAYVSDAALGKIYLSSRLQFLQGGGFYSWFGVGVGSSL